MTRTVLTPLTSLWSRASRWPIKQSLTSVSWLAWLIAVKGFEVPVINAASAQLAIVFLLQAASVLGERGSAVFHALQDDIADDSGSPDHDDLGLEVDTHADVPSAVGNQLTASQAEESRPDPCFDKDRIDACLAKFLAVTQPELLHSFPSIAIPQTYRLPLSEWTSRTSAGDATIAVHPAIPHLYAVTLPLPGISTQSVWRIINDTEARSRWDSASAGARSIAELNTNGTEASLVHLKTKGRFPVKATDMAMLAVNARANEHTFIRALTSVTDARIPVTRDFDRIHLEIAGFALKDTRNGGCEITQILDLSALGSWLPSRVMSAITHTALPKGLRRLGALAQQLPVNACSDDHQLPSIVGRGKVATGPKAGVRSPSPFLALNDEMRTILARLERLESAGSVAAGKGMATKVRKRFRSGSLLTAIVNTFFSAGSASTLAAFIFVFLLRWYRRRP